MVCRIEGETETEQSAIDPLDPCSSSKYPLYNLASPVAFVLHPMEAVIIPQVKPCHNMRIFLHVFQGGIVEMKSK